MILWTVARSYRTAYQQVVGQDLPLPGQVVTSADFRFDLEHPYWDVSVEVPNPTASAAPEHGAFVSVDAVSGVVTVGKSY